MNLSSRAPSLRPPRGNVLLLVVVIVAVLGIIGVAALTLSAAESKVVNQKIHTDMMMQCARAAGGKVWAEFAQYGLTPKGTVSVVNIPSTSLTNGASAQDLTVQLDHYDTTASAFSTVEWYSNTSAKKPLDSNLVGGNITNNDNTNKLSAFSMGGQPYVMTAHCRDRSNNQYEVELVVKLGI